MASYLKTNTAVTLCVGPFLDKTDGVTPETALTVSNCKITVVAETDENSAPTLILDNVAGNDGTNTLAHITNDDAGYYSLKLTAANLNRLGRLKVGIFDAANHCPVFHEYVILPAVVYDSLVLGTDLLDVNVSKINETSQTARDLGASVLLSSGTGAGQISLSSGAVLLQATQTGVTIPTVTTLTNAPSDSSGVATLLSRLSATRAGYLDLLNSYLDSAASAIKTVVDAIKLKTDNLSATPASTGDAMTLTVGERTAIANEVEAQIIDDADSEKVLTAITNKIAAVNPSLSGLTLAAIAAQVRTELAVELARIDVNIASRLASAGYVAPNNLTLAAIAEKTANLPIDPASQSLVEAAMAGLTVSVDLSEVTERTNRLPDDPASQSEVEAAIAAIGEGITVNASVAVSSTVARAVSSGRLGLTTFYTFKQSISSTVQENLSAADKLWLAIKRADRPDSESLIFIEKTGGLTVVNKTDYANTEDGSLVVTGSAGAWDVEIVIKEEATSLLSGYAGEYAAELKALINGDALCVWSGTCEIYTGVVRAIE